MHTDGQQGGICPTPPPTPPVDTAYISSYVPQLISSLLEGDPERINYPSPGTPLPVTTPLPPVCVMHPWSRFCIHSCLLHPGCSGLEALPAPSEYGHLSTLQTTLKMTYIETRLKNESVYFQGMLQYHFPECRKHPGRMAEDTEQLVSREVTYCHANISEKLLGL